MNTTFRAIAVAIVLSGAVPVQGDVIKYTNKAQWQSLVGEHTTITFTEMPMPALITTQYSYLGITFTEGDDALVQSNSMINDTIGLFGNFGYPNETITISFAQPITSFGIDHPGHEAFKLYSGSTMIFDTGLMGSGGTGFFSGVISTIPFDKIVIDDPFGVTAIDDLHFGPPIPAPGALGVVALAVALGVRRRRRE